MTTMCPHCGVTIEIISLNCGIFRCGIFKSNGQQMNPHASKEYCEKIVKEQLIFGCGKPFCIINGKISKCEYT